MSRGPAPGRRRVPPSRTAAATASFFLTGAGLLLVLSLGCTSAPSPPSGSPPDAAPSQGPSAPAQPSAAAAQPSAAAVPSLPLPTVESLEAELASVADLPRLPEKVDPRAPPRVVIDRVQACLRGYPLQFPLAISRRGDQVAELRHDRGPWLVIREVKTDTIVRRIPLVDNELIDRIKRDCRNVELVQELEQGLLGVNAMLQREGWRSFACQRSDPVVHGKECAQPLDELTVEFEEPWILIRHGAHAILNQEVPAWTPPHDASCKIVYQVVVQALDPTTGVVVVHADGEFKGDGDCPTPPLWEVHLLRMPRQRSRARDGRERGAP